MRMWEQLGRLKSSAWACWLPGGPTRERGSPRLHVIGNCQAGGIAAAMRLLLPNADVGFTSAFGIHKTFPRMADLIAATEGCSTVFATSFAAPFRDGGDFETLRAAVRLVQIPIVVFSAFHPDVVYVGRNDAEGRGLVYGPMGSYHSALTLFAFLENLPEAEALRLFRREALARVGYFGVWDESLATLLELGRHAEYPLAEDVARWTRRGAFMHGVNHPKMFVAADLARGLLRRADIPFEDCDLDSYLADDFVRSGTWPVYGPIAEHYGVPAGGLFLKSPSVRSGPARTFSYETFVGLSYASYRRRDRKLLVNERVGAWRDDEALRRDLCALARNH